MVTDDFGDEVARCRYTGALLWPDQGAAIGATIPGVRTRYVMAKTPEAKALHKAQGVAFHESEANCNTCSGLQRVRREKSRDGFQFGRCTNPGGEPERSPYADRTIDGVMAFHPDDPMHMPCYESRWTFQSLFTREQRQAAKETEPAHVVQLPRPHP